MEQKKGSVNGLDSLPGLASLLRVVSLLTVALFIAAGLAGCSVGEQLTGSVAVVGDDVGMPESGSSNESAEAQQENGNFITGFK